MNSVRVEKVAAILKSDLATSTLRVCWSNKDRSYNCEKCDKCLRTMINLYLAGALGRCKTLPAQLDLYTIARANSQRRTCARCGPAEPIPE